MDVEKIIRWLIVIVIFLILVPFGIYKGYYAYQENLYPSLNEYASYNSRDGKFTVDVMSEKGYGAEESINLKVYLTNNDTGDMTFIGVRDFDTYSSSEVTFSEDTTVGYEITVIFSGHSTTDTLVIDCNEAKESGKKFLGIF